MRSGIRVTAQFNSKIFYPNGSKPSQWCSSQLSNIDFNEDKSSLFADDCAMELNEDGTAWTIKSLTDENAIVNVKITRTAPAIQAGKTGLTSFGTDLSNPWGTMRHAFWPRCVAEGTITTKDGPIDFKGRALYVYALQGMKPHHGAAKWNFIYFQGEKYTASIMEFTTPPSYGSTVVTVGVIAKDGEIVTAGTDAKIVHTKVKGDPENDWPEPETAQFTWLGKTKDGKAVEAVVEGALEERVDRVDIMAEVPGFVKKIVAGAVGTKPYIYQVCRRDSPYDQRLTMLTGY